MRLKILVSLLFSFGCVFSQDEIKQNVWSSIQLLRKSNRMISAFDAGFRLNDHFIRQPRQGFVRFLGVFQLKESNNYLGGGIAYFEHRIQKMRTWDSEFRPFLQFQSQKINGKANLKVRVRNEFRIYYERAKVVNRSRAQVQFLYPVFVPELKFQLSEELFYSLSLLKPWENRASIGFQYDCNPKLQLGLNYILQFQEANRAYAQHIFSVNLNYSF